MYDERNFIKNIFIKALITEILIYGSISYFNKKTDNEIFKIVSVRIFKIVYVDKDVARNSLSFQLINISGSYQKLKDSKIYNFSLTRIGEKRKRKMAEPIETVIVCLQENFEIAGGLNPLHIKLKMTEF